MNDADQKGKGKPPSKFMERFGQPKTSRRRRSLPISPFLTQRKKDLRSNEGESKEDDVLAAIQQSEDDKERDHFAGEVEESDDFNKDFSRMKFDNKIESSFERCESPTNVADTDVIGDERKVAMKAWNEGGAEMDELDEPIPSDRDKCADPAKLGEIQPPDRSGVSGKLEEPHVPDRDGTDGPEHKVTELWRRHARCEALLVGNCDCASR